MKKTVLVPLIALLVSSLLILGFVYQQFILSEKPLTSTLVYPKAKPLPSFQLTDHDNNAFTEQQLKDKWSVLFFGFTFCPDVCPTTLAALSQVAGKLSKEQQAKIQFVFVSVDPERDTVERLAEYIPFYNEDFIALTGDQQQLSKFALSLGAVYMKVPEGDGYTMSHSDRLFIVNPQGERFGIFTKSPTGGIDIEAIAKDLQQILDK